MKNNPPQIKYPKVYYDTEIDAMHIRLGKGGPGKYGGTMKIKEWLLLDKDITGNLINIEILDVSRHLPKRALVELAQGIKNGIVDTYKNQKQRVVTI